VPVFQPAAPCDMDATWTGRRNKVKMLALRLFAGSIALHPRGCGQSMGEPRTCWARLFLLSSSSPEAYALPEVADYRNWNHSALFAKRRSARPLWRLDGSKELSKRPIRRRRPEQVGSAIPWPRPRGGLETTITSASRRRRLRADQRYIRAWPALFATWPDKETYRKSSLAFL
jgi:hypothetical protein